MSELLSKIRNNHDLFYKVSLFVVAIITIVYFFPKEATFKYDFQKNQPWRYETLIAPYDIPVFRSDEEIDKDKKRIKLEKKLYFSINTSKILEKNKEFIKLFDDEWVSYKKQNTSLWNKTFSSDEALKNKQKKEEKRLKQLGVDVLNAIYNRGVLELTSAALGVNDSTKFYIKRNNYYAASYLNEIFTPKTAYEFAERNLVELKEQEAAFLMNVFEFVFSKNAANIAFDNIETENVLKQEMGKVVLKETTVKKGFRIIEKGTLIDADNFKVLKSFERKYKSQKKSVFSKYTIGIGQTLLVTILMVCLVLYLLFFRDQLMENNKNIVFLLFVIVSFVVFTTVVLKYELFNLYIVPICLAPIVIRSFFDTRTAFFIHLLIVLLLGFIVPNGFHFIFLQLVAGMMGIYGFSNFRNRSQLFYTVLIIAISYSICYVALNIIIEGDFAEIDWVTIGFLAISSLFILLAYPLIYAFEKLFGFMSDVTLLELADTNNPLLRDLARKAPGTFQHSLQVANLAESATSLIGGNALLIRTAALYHDIGKMDAPMYFIENQSTGLNPHDELSYEESAQIIIGHVLKGVEIAKKNGVPDKIIDFIRTHHGTTTTGYFFKMYLNENPDETPEAAAELFTYPGPIPFSKESAILMMADSVEAASRSIKVPDAENIAALVDGIITNQMKEGQFENADITLKDITQIKKMFAKMLMNIYHVRIEYPR